jgi:hypothetical protein
MRHDVADDELDARRRVVAPGAADARGVGVDPRDMGRPPPELRREQALAAADVERPVAPSRRRVQEQRVVVDVVVPAPVGRRHGREASQAGPSDHVL